MDLRDTGGMLRHGPTVFARQKLSLDFVTLKHACPKGIYVAQTSEQDLLWSGVIFVRKGQYAGAVFRFHVAFTEDYPARPPTITFVTDVFHPLVAPLTTYTYTTRDRGSDTISAGDEGQLPPGGMTLRHGFPEWYGSEMTTSDDSTVEHDHAHTASALRGSPTRYPHIIEVLQYMRVVLDTEAVLDSVPLDVAANPGAWHAWRSYRARSQQLAPTVLDGTISRDRSMSPSKQQPGGARRPGEWNWTGVWEDRVKKAVQASTAESTLFGSEGNNKGRIEFVKLDDAAIGKLAPIMAAHAE